MTFLTKKFEIKKVFKNNSLKSGVAGKLRPPYYHYYYYYIYIIVIIIIIERKTLGVLFIFLI
jgi:hypothetical protein